MRQHKTEACRGGSDDILQQAVLTGSQVFLCEPVIAFDPAQSGAGQSADIKRSHHIHRAGQNQAVRCLLPQNFCQVLFKKLIEALGNLLIQISDKGIIKKRFSFWTKSSMT